MTTTSIDGSCSNVLILGDLHIHHFLQHNINGDQLFRLNQYKKLAERLTEIVDKYECHAIIQCGDFFHVPSPPPYIVNAGVAFLEALNSIPIHLTHGQHDFCSKTRMSSENTLLSVLDKIHNVFYLHNTAKVIGKTLFYFKGWTQDFVINSELLSHTYGESFRALITHASIHGVDINQYGHQLTGTDSIGEDILNKFDICFAGDIHYPHEKGNIVIPGVPLQTNINDHHDTSVVIYNTNTGKWFREKIDTPNHKFLKFMISDNPSNDPYIIHKPRIKKVQADTGSAIKSINVDEIISEIVNQHELSDIHTKITSKTKTCSWEDINYNFSVKKLVINNLRLIDNLELVPLDGLTLVAGPNGTCKSTVTSAMVDAIRGFSDPRKAMRNGADLFSTEIHLDYCGNTYKIFRQWKGFGRKGSGLLQLYINDVEVESNNKNELEKRIVEELRFLHLIDLMYFDQSRSGFLSSYNYAERLALIGKALNLSVIENTYTCAVNELNDLTKQATDITSSIIGKEEYLQGIELTADFSLLETDFFGQLAELKTKEATTDHLLTLEESATSLQHQIDAVNHTLSLITVPPIDRERGASLPIELAETTKRVEDSVERLATVSAKITEHETELASFERKICDNEKENQRISSLFTKLQDTGFCNECGQLVPKVEADILILRYQDTLGELAEELNALQQSVKTVSAGLQSKRADKLILTKAVEENNKKLQALRDEQLALDNALTWLEHYTVNTTHKNSLEQKYLAVVGEQNVVRNQLKDEDLHLFHTTTEFRDYLKQQITVIEVAIAKQDELQKLKKVVDSYKSDIETLKNKVNQLNTSIQRYTQYVKLFSSTGVILQVILQTVSELLSSERIQVRTFKKLVNDNISPDLTVDLKVFDNWIDYNQLSGGQKTLVDISIIDKLIKVVGGIGFLILDETLKFVDQESLEVIVEVLKELAVKNTFIVSHESGFPAYDHMLLSNFTDNGVSFSYLS